MRFFKRKKEKFNEENLILDRRIFTNYFYFIRHTFNRINVKSRYWNYDVFKDYLIDIDYTFDEDDELIMAYNCTLNNYKLSKEIFAILSYDKFCTRMVFLSIEDFCKIQEKQIFPSWYILLNRASMQITRFNQDVDLLRIIERFDNVIFLEEEIKPRTILTLKKGKEVFKELNNLKDLEKLKITNNTRMHD